MDKWINIHTHRPGIGYNIFDPCLGGWQCSEEGKIFRSAGIHPQFIDDHVEERLSEIQQLAATGDIVAIGECGMDRNVEAPMSLQCDLFRKQAALASDYGLPVIIHGVRAVSELSAEAKHWKGDKMWIMHGFNNRREVLKDLLRHGIYISVGRHVMNDSSNVCQLVREIPLDTMFLETDNSEWSIKDIYMKVSQLRGIPLDELQNHVYDNFKRLFYKLLNLE